jgi:hypothetical protein
VEAQDKETMEIREKEPVITQEPIGKNLGEGIDEIIEGYQDEEEVSTRKIDYGINNLQESLTLRLKIIV